MGEIIVTSENLFFVIFLWFSFGFQHSFFAQKYVKNIVGNFLGHNFLKFGYRFVYFLSQCFIFPIFMYFVMSVEPGSVIWVVPEKYYLLFMCVKIFSQYLLLFSVLSVDVNHFIGTKQVFIYFKCKLFKELLPSDDDLISSNLNTKYLFQIVRHPMYLGILLSFITNSIVFNELTLVNFICLIAYIEIGIFFEERGLVRDFKGYEDYQKKVPKINPIFHLRRIIYHD